MNRSEEEQEKFDKIRNEKLQSLQKDIKNLIAELEIDQLSAEYNTGRGREVRITVIFNQNSIDS